MRLFQRFEEHLRKNYWSPFGMDESSFNKDVDNKGKIHYHNDTVDILWQGFRSGYNIDIKLNKKEK